MTSTTTLRTPTSLGRATGREGDYGDLPATGPDPSATGSDGSATCADPSAAGLDPTTVRGAQRTAGRVRARQRWSAVVAQGSDTGMATAEYAIAMIAAVGFAGLLVTVLSSGTVRGLLTGLVTSALSIG